jgi:hypothetical protein
MVNISPGDRRCSKHYRLERELLVSAEENTELTYPNQTHHIFNENHWYFNYALVVSRLSYYISRWK